MTTLYDLLIDAVNEINIVFSLQVILTINQSMLFNLLQISSCQLIPLFLLVMVSMVFSVYSFIYKGKTGTISPKSLLILMNWNFYQLNLIVIAHLSDTIRKIVIYCDDKEVLKGVIKVFIRQC